MLKSVNNKQYVSNIIINQHKVVLLLFIINTYNLHIILIRFKIIVFSIPYRINVFNVKPNLAE